MIEIERIMILLNIVVSNEKLKKKAESQRNLKNYEIQR